ncbi:MAG: SelB C-terminal domain-containing protein, partial [Chloroflexota bacterium]|nr:SelB C-terminal domain-containing protein [Chloroflexota bacterium]
LRLIPDALRELRTNDEVDLFTGAAEVLARATVLDGKSIAPGESGWIRLRLAEPLAAVKGDKFILRLPSPSVTIGGGEIVDTSPRLHHRFRGQTLAWLRSLEEGSPEQILLSTLAADHPVEARAALTRSGLDPAQAAESLQRLVENGQVVRLDEYLISATAWQIVTARAQRELDDFHRRFPLRPGMPKEELKSRLGWPIKQFNAAVERWVEDAAVGDRGAALALAGFELKLSPEVQAKLDRAVKQLGDKPYSPPSETELGLSTEELALLASQGAIIRVSENVIFARSAYEAMVAGTVKFLEEHGKMTMAQFRDEFETSRKYAQAFLEHLDERKVTRRVGDERLLLRRP